MSRHASLALAAAAVLAMSGCGTGAASSANSRIRVEDSHWENNEGRCVHDFTLVNGNQLGVRDVVVRFHYLDDEGREVGRNDHRFSSALPAHDAVRESQIDGGPMPARAAKVTYEVVRARANLRDGSP